MTFSIEKATARKDGLAKLSLTRTLNGAELDLFDKLDRQCTKYQQGWRPTTKPDTLNDTRGGVDKKSTAEDRDFSNYLRTGYVGPSMTMTRSTDASDLETRAELDSASMQTVPGQGGYMVPQGFWAHLQVALKSYGGISSYMQQISTPTGTEMPWPTANPTGIVGQYITEANQVGFTDYTFGQGIMYAWTITSGVILASLQLIQDSAVSVDDFVAARMGEAIGRKIATEALNGLGSASKAYTGVLTSLTAYGATTSQPSGGVYTLGAATQVKTFGNTSGSSELLLNTLAPATVFSLINSIDPSMWPNSKFYMSAAQALNLHQVIDSNGRPLLNFKNGLSKGMLTNDIGGSGASGAVVGRLAGFPVVVDNSIGVLTASTLTGPLFGDLGRAMVQRTVKQAGVMRLTERYADFLQVGYLGFVRGDITPNDLRAIVGVKSAAT